MVIQGYIALINVTSNNVTVGETNKELSADYVDILGRCLGVAKNGFYVQYFKPQPQDIGFEGSTFEGKL